MKRGWKYWLDPYRLFTVLGIAALFLWWTLLLGGFAYLYWTGRIDDPRNIFGSVLSDLGAIMIFPVGWIGLLWAILNEHG